MAECQNPINTDSQVKFVSSHSSKYAVHSRTKCRSSWAQGRTTQISIGILKRENKIEYQKYRIEIEIL